MIKFNFNEITICRAIALLLFIFTSSVIYSQTKNETLCKIDSIIKLGNKTYSQNSDLSISFYRKADSLALLLKNESKHIKILQKMSRPQIRSGKYEEAQKNLKITIDYYKARKDSFNLAKSFTNLGWLMNEKRSHPLSLAYYMNTLDIYTALKDKKGQHNLWNKIGLVYLMQNKYDKALEYYTLVIESSERNKIYNSYTAALSNASWVYSLKEDFETAKELLFKSLVRRKKLSNNHRSKAIGYEDLAAYYKKTKDYPKAVIYGDSSLFYWRKLNYYTRQAYSEMSITESHILNKDIPNAKKMMIAARNTASRIHHPSVNRRLLESSTKLNLALGNYKQAYEDKAREKLLSDSIRLANSMNFQDEIIKLLNEEKEVAKRAIYEKEIAFQQKDLEKSKVQRSILSILIGFLTLLLLLSVIINRYRKRKNKELSDKNKIIDLNLEEKEVLLQEIHHRVKNNLQMISSMLNMQSKYIKDSGSKNAILESRERVKAMAMIHHKLHIGSSYKAIFIDEYIANLTNALINSYSRVMDTIHVELELQEKLSINLDRMLPLGMIVNEVITNVLKYAYTEKSEYNELFIRLTYKDNLLTIMIKDNGIGLPLDFESKKGYGFKLIDAFLDKLKGDIETHNNNGAVIILSFENFKLNL